METLRYLGQNTNKKLRIGAIIKLETGQYYKLIGKTHKTVGGSGFFKRTWKPIKEMKNG